MKIIGAGLSGLLAGCMFPGSTIYEQQSSLPNNHGAVLRFRSDKIANALGIPFKKVRVTKAIWYAGKEVEPTPRIQNLYSAKVTGCYGQRSIADIAPCDRYIAPTDLISQLAARCNIVYNYSAESFDESEPTISTMPMHTLLTILKNASNYPGVTFQRAAIWSQKYKVPGVNLYQTIYFPSEWSYQYRASFSGDELIVELVDDPMKGGIDLIDIGNAFGMDLINNAIPQKVVRQTYGKIVPIDNDMRRSIMADLTHELNIYSLGRYATWRNILLDDVFDDIIKIRDLIKLDSYSRRLAL